MTRATLVAANKAQAQAASLRMVYFVKVAFPSGTVYAATASRDFVWGGQTWLHRWIIGKVPEVTEKPDLKPYAAELVFSGLDTTLKSKILTDKYHFAEVSCWKGFCTEAWALVATPHQIAKRVLSNCVLRMDGKTGTIAVSAQGPEVIWGRDAAQLATPESQRLRYPTDTGLDRVLDQGTKVIEWGGVLQRGGGPTVFRLGFSDGTVGVYPDIE
ncbi:MAG: hypothetical protein ACREU7_08795 [Burkholderiales bacterium]